MLRYEVDSHRVTLTIDDPERRNPLTNETVDALREAVAAAAADDSVRVIVITGAGDKAFCAGGDLSGGFFDEPIATHHERGSLAELIKEMRRCGKPIVARINGHALAGGFGLALACDLGIAVDHATFGTPEIDVGLWPMMISAVIQRSLPRKVALDLMMTGRRIDASEALRIGAVSQVVAPDELDAAVSDLVEALAAKSPVAMRLGRDSFYAVEDMPLPEALEYLSGALTAIALTDDAREGLTAFVEKRRPQWRGR